MAYTDPNDPNTQQKRQPATPPALDETGLPYFGPGVTTNGDFGNGTKKQPATPPSQDENGGPYAGPGVTTHGGYGSPTVGAGSTNPAATTNGGNYGGTVDDKALRSAMDGNYGAATTNTAPTAIASPAAPVTYADNIPGATTSPVNPTAPKDVPPAAAPPATSSAPPADPNDPDPFATIGGGKKYNGGWVPKDYPVPGEAPGASGPGATTAPVGTPGATGAAPGSQPGLAATAAAASTISGTPTAAPLANTTNQGTQDVLRNSLLARATQSTDVNTNDPTFRKVADTYSAGQERSRRAATDMDAERLAAQGMGSSGEMDAQRRMEGEKSAQASAGFESQLALSELQNKRSEISSAIAGLGDAVGGDQARALQEKLAQLDATIKEKSLAQTGQLGNADINLRSQLGTGSLNLQGMGLLLQNQQNNNRLGFDIGAQNSQNNNAALRAALGI